ncbi:MAG: putative rane protein [Marmoricola sp.]|nr:putative rane protein [Marmoricola sp.]
MSCSFAHYDGSYVLGALSPAERQGFEEHLSGCDECSRSVRELAGLPGLLARVDPQVLASPPIGEPVPDTLLPALVQEVRRVQRRRALVTAGLAAAAAVVVVVGALAVTGGFDDAGAPAAAPPTSRTAPSGGHSMLQVGRVPVSANLALTGVLWGTKLDLTCTYSGGGEYGTPPPQTYAMFVHTRDGHVEQVATWRALPGKTMRLAAATAANRTDITSVEVRTASGKAVLRLVA